MPGFTSFPYKFSDQISAQEYVDRFHHLPIIDVRSPAEFTHGHIPGAINIPLFTNEERAIVGTLYKQVGKKRAMEKGFDFVSSKMKGIVDRLNALTMGSVEGSKEIIIYCWRGGLRSRSICWLAAHAGIQSHQIVGGYKGFRTYIQNSFYKVPQNIIVVGGKTGTGKTKILHELARNGEQIIDLEATARHKGSAFGFIDEPDQPTVEQFENNLFVEYQKLNSTRIWVENESRSIGRVFIPMGFWEKMKSSMLIHIEMDIDRRTDHLVEIYGCSDKNLLKNAFEKIKRRLGDLRYNQSIDYIDSGDLKSAAKEALIYYDKTYNYGLENNLSPDITLLNAEDSTFSQLADELVKISNRKDIK